MTNHISKQQYDQLPDTEKAGWEKKSQVFDTFTKSWRSPEPDDWAMGVRDIYVPIQPEILTIGELAAKSPSMQRKGYYSASEKSAYMHGAEYGASIVRQQTIQEVKEMVKGAFGSIPPDTDRHYYQAYVRDLILTQLNNLKL